MKKLLIFILFPFLFSCATQKRAERYFDRNVDDLAVYVDGNREYTEKHGAAYAAKYFPVKVLPPDTVRRTIIVPGRLIPVTVADLPKDGTPLQVKCPDCENVYEQIKETVIDSAALQAMRNIYNAERLEHDKTKGKLSETEEVLDATDGKAKQRFWIITVMIIAVVGGLFLRFILPLVRR